jgi:hypothetical protein
MKPAAGQLRPRVLAWLFVATGLLVLVGANWHLVHVATVSQPDCVPHLRQSQSDRGEYRAAVSSCSLK